MLQRLSLRSVLKGHTMSTHPYMSMCAANQTVSWHGMTSGHQVSMPALMDP